MSAGYATCEGFCIQVPGLKSSASTGRAALAKAVQQNSFKASETLLLAGVKKNGVGKCHSAGDLSLKSKSVQPALAGMHVKAYLVTSMARIASTAQPSVSEILMTYGLLA